MSKTPETFVSGVLPWDGHALKGVRVQKVQRVHRVQRGWWAPLKLLKAPVCIKPLQPPCGRWKSGPLWWLAPPPFPRKRNAIALRSIQKVHVIMACAFFLLHFYPVNKKTNFFQKRLDKLKKICGLRPVRREIFNC